MVPRGKDYGSPDSLAAEKEIQEMTSVDMNSVLHNLSQQPGGFPTGSQNASQPVGPIQRVASNNHNPTNHNNGMNANLQQFQQMQNNQNNMGYSNFGDLNPLINDLLNFKFSSNRTEEIEILRQTIHDAMNKMAISQVANKTKQSNQKVNKFSVITNKSNNNVVGLTACFSVLKNPYKMKVIGDFYGNEILSWQVDGDQVIGHVMQEQPDGSFFNISDNYKIKVEEI